MSKLLFKETCQFSITDLKVLPFLEIFTNGQVYRDVL